jgi:ADP-heptose:LPS heptosyltransferase
MFVGRPLSEIAYLLGQCDSWIAVDNFLPHMASYLGVRGIVLWGQSDPKIFGCKENVNLLKHPKYLRKNQFDYWENAEYKKQAFVEPEKVMVALTLLIR